MSATKKQQRKGPELDITQVLLRPIVTEKSTDLAENLNQYTFEVHPYADKALVRQAVEELFGVRVLRVRVLKKPGKTRRTRFRVGRTRSQKKAVVTLHPEDRLSFA